MTRKRWRKLMQAQLAKAGDNKGQTMNDLKAAKIIIGQYGACWENTGNAASASYAEHYADAMNYAE